ncbi:MAG: hypothetical protein OEX18_08775 [Candidatus Krumholzibacteria bacterium]|nr:hypothetical protein [Candidatus Krumholzibacteria bacterium]MDH4337349.1 hypothetical protein [Candidatus Krumholzibacteria bacterium]MDH5270110.1 hypothetical protein [Candidatus Krumholzibacteria bacterium]
MKSFNHNILRLLAAGLLVTLAACSEQSTAPEEPKDTGYTSRTLTRDDLTPQGTVIETDDGYQVQGSLDVKTDDGGVSFVNADLDVSFDEKGRVRNITGTTEIPSPHERIEFANPVQADVGFFSGKFLNENRDFGILLKEDTDYFVFNFAVTLEMSIATGETGDGATRPVKVRAPLGGQLLMIMDFNDPMYYVYGAQDLIGNAGTGWSLHGRIPFAPWHPVEGMGNFDGKNTRVGSFPILKVIQVSGQMVDNNYTEVHLSLEDPFTSDLRMGYQCGYNGAMALDLFLKDIVGVEIPIAEGSGGMWREASVQDIFQGHAYVNGLTADLDWWPAFIPAKPVAALETSGFVKSDLDFDISVAGEFGWNLPAGKGKTLTGHFGFAPEALTLGGSVRDDATVYNIEGRVTRDETTVWTVPPQSILDGVSNGVTDELDDRIAEAEQAWNNLQDATKDYEFELSLRGLRSSLPGVVDTAKKALSDGIAAELRKHEGEDYYSQLKTHLYAADNTYYEQLNRLKAAAQQIQDNDATRNEIEAALRSAASKKIFSTTFKYKVLGVTVKTVNVSRRVMSDSQANQLITAADNVKYIKETYDRKVSMQQIYDTVPDKEIFEQVKDDIENGVIMIDDLGEIGFVYGHDSKVFNVYAVVGEDRFDLGAVDLFSVVDITAAVTSAIVDGLVSGN